MSEYEIELGCSGRGESGNGAVLGLGMGWEEYIKEYIKEIFLNLSLLCAHVRNEEGLINMFIHPQFTNLCMIHAHADIVALWGVTIPPVENVQ